MFRIETGEKTVNRGFAIRAANGTTWYRHDTVYAKVDGKEIKLEGFIQLRRRCGSLEAITCFRGGCVQGSDPAWLLRQNQNPEF